MIVSQKRDGQEISWSKSQSGALASEEAALGFASPP